ncbi:hypothetical protein LOTGIDRAFT_235458 [Lottia gigantea]|uniref:Chitin-binding type-2 domain-containing protein n=1 Tax=Lottia gigantea TaxID=225164 RepID=V3ZV36_LOTGI|nr:hypothetical protein LOTGIDRAFT_235458 [Lottia gigantea]ESO86425.1 hypothetical protein LOTGIDRAFT_235458 [Lottia gigantea]
MEMSFSASMFDGHVTSQDLNDVIHSTSMLYASDSFNGNSLESLDSSLETSSFVIGESVTETPIDFTSETEVSSINPSSSIVDIMSTSMPIPKPDVKATGETVYQDQGNLTFICTVDNYHNFTSINLEYDGVIIFNMTGNDHGFEDSEWTLVQTTNDETLTLAATYNNPTCEDTEKSFRCSVNGDWGVVEDSTSSVVKVKPGIPEIYLPIKFIENEDTGGDIYCSVDKGVPAATVSWSVEFVEEDPNDFSVLTTINSNKTCSNIVKSSIRRKFDKSWHNASLCCTATQDQITTSTCKKLYIIPADYCVGKEDKLYDHPYDDCYLFIQCGTNITYINTCGASSRFCFNENTQGCTDAVATTTDPNFVDDPYSCEGKPNYAYIPVEGSCKNYTRCVHGEKKTEVCSGDSYFVATPENQNIVCDRGIDNAYCKRSGIQSTEATTTDPNFVDDPYSCEGKPNYAYIPVEGSCKNYTRCVHGEKKTEVCAGDTYFVATPKNQNIVCDRGIDNAYCKRSGIQSTESP